MQRKPDSTYCLFGAAAVLERVETLAKELRRNAEMDIHDVRVASRRLRAALRLFEDCWPAGRVKAWQKILRRLTRSLGVARDIEVQIEAVRALLARTKRRDLRPGLERLLLRLRQRRSAAGPDVDAAIRHTRSSRLLDEMAGLMKPPASAAGPIKRAAASAALRRHAHRRVRELIKDMLRYQEYLPLADCHEEVHQMRIAAKRLRYTLEVFRPLRGEALDEAIRCAEGLQQVLGDLHDCDVWQQYLPQFLQEERKRTVEHFGRDAGFGRLVPGIEHMLSLRRLARRRIHRKSLEFWKQAQDNRVWEKCLKIV